MIFMPYIYLYLKGINMKELIDTHAHLDFKNFKKDFENVVSAAMEHGIMKIINIATNPESIDHVVKLVKTHKMIYGTLGIHPHDAKNATDRIFDKIKKLAIETEKIVAIGEVGLDFHYYHSPEDVQKKVFSRFINLAKNINLPLVIHNRKSDDAMYEILKNEKASDAGAVFHCFSSDWNYAKKILDLGLYISVTGVVTFKNAKLTHEVVKKVPLDRLMIETDCPFLTPEPYRGKRNEPSYVRFIAQQVAELRGIDVDEVAQATTNNAKKFFNLPD